MEKNSVFSITSNNYFSRAITLMDSIYEYNKEVDMFIFICDKKSAKINYEVYNCKIYFLDDLKIKNINEMQYKYNVTELNTAIKPFIFKYLFVMGYYKVLYLDPDLYFYKDINCIFNYLDKKSIALTPHVLEPSLASFKYSYFENEILGAGTFNLGFCGIKNNDVGRKICDWWDKKLEHSCYYDYAKGLFYDQKWMNFIIGFFPNELYVIDEPGCNIGPWNFEERIINKITNTVELPSGKKGELIFIHFSEFNPHTDKFFINKHYFDLSLSEEILQLSYDYSKKLLSNQFDKYYQVQYAYNFYNNGMPIIPLHRQLYRKISEKNDVHFKDLFETGTNSFYNALLKSKLVIRDFTIEKKKEVKDFEKKSNKVNKLLLLIKRLLGLKKYLMLMKYLNYISRYDNEVFLIKEKEMLKAIEEGDKNEN